MKSNYNGQKNLITISITLLFCLFVLGYDNYTASRSQAIIKQHAQVVASALWNIDRKGVLDYLSFAVVSNNYKRLTVYDQPNEILHSVENPEEQQFDGLLTSLHLSPQLTLSSNIIYNNQNIGRIEALWTPPTIYTHVYVLFASVLITIILHLYLTVRNDKKNLEIRVTKRTEELARTNRSLLQEIHQKKKSTTNLRRSEEEYRKLYRQSRSAEELYRSFFDSSVGAILVYDLYAGIKLANQSFTNMFGWKQQEVKGKKPVLFAASYREKTEKLIDTIHRQGISCHSVETYCINKDGKEFPASLSGSRFNDHRGKPAGIVLVVHDISERKKMERQLHQAERMDAVGTLAGGIAHDFNNLLMGIQGNISLTLMEIPPDSTPYNRLKSIETYIRNGQELTSQLLGFARGGKYEVKPTDLNKLIHKETKLFARTRKDLTIQEEYEREIWVVDVDQGQIRQVLLNLFVNAGQAMEDSGTLRISTSNEAIDAIFTGTYEIPAGKYVKITVSDTGHGMNKQTQARIFDPFFTTKEIGRGTGLGLASAYGIIKNHTGYINVYSEVGEGATFNIYLPASEKKITSGEDTESIEPVKGRGRVLLVDDEQMILDIGRELITALGYDVTTANSGKDACHIFSERPYDFDVVILDMIMPGMEGGAVFDELKQINPEVRVILSSGYSLSGKAANIMSRGCSAFLQKPFDLKTLSVKLQEVIALGRTEV